ncbi:hypothetical protein [Paenibacillus xylanexedens]|uniref:hypothetical protein n=1 Tax=Paenibacillus xylanexedens TaxID=528191 RepID=UPI0011AAE470|nr:hypothetical protein [Paenibacillus xylanexedens]
MDRGDQRMYGTCSFSQPLGSQVQAHRQMQMMVKLGIYGPEVKMLEDNAADYLSRKPLIRQEHAAIMYA